MVWHKMHLNLAFVMVEIVDRHFGIGTVTVSHNLAIDDGFADDVEVAFDVAAHDDMGVDVMWVVVFQFL